MIPGWVQQLGIRRTETSAGAHAHAVVRVVDDRLMSGEELPVHRHNLAVQRQDVLRRRLHLVVLATRLAGIPVSGKLFLRFTYISSKLSSRYKTKRRREAVVDAD